MAAKATTLATTTLATTPATTTLERITQAGLEVTTRAGLGVTTRAGVTTVPRDHLGPTRDVRCATPRCTVTVRARRLMMRAAAVDPVSMG